MNFIYNATIPDTNAVFIAPLELFASVRARIVGKTGDGVPDPLKGLSSQVLWVDFLPCWLLDKSSFQRESALFVGNMG